MKVFEKKMQMNFLKATFVRKFINFLYKSNYLQYNYMSHIASFYI